MHVIDCLLFNQDTPPCMHMPESSRIYTSTTDSSNTPTKHAYQQLYYRLNYENEITVKSSHGVLFLWSTVALHEMQTAVL
jgi:hypothetical protein